MYQIGDVDSDHCPARLTARVSLHVILQPTSRRYARLTFFIGNGSARIRARVRAVDTNRARRGLLRLAARVCVSRSKIATVCLGLLAIVLGIVFEKQNVAFMVGLAFCIAASCNFPVLLLSIYWRGLTTRGAFIGGFLGLISAVVMVVLLENSSQTSFGHLGLQDVFGDPWF